MSYSEATSLDDNKAKVSLFRCSRQLLMHCSTS